jgi:hypothetical protein
MSVDFLCQYVTKDILGSAPAVTASGFTPVDPVSTWIIPAGSRHDTAGVGRVAGVTNSYRFWLLSALLSANGDSLDFERINTGDNTSETARGAVQLLTYLGRRSGPNELIRRHHEVLSLPTGQTQVDSSPIQGFTDINRCVPGHFCRTDRTSKTIGETQVYAEIVNASGVNVVRLRRGVGSGNIIAVVDVTEFTGSNWGVQKVVRTFTAADTDQDNTITTADPLKSILIRSSWTAGGNNGPAHGTKFAYLSSSTNLRQRAELLGTSNAMVTYIVTNSQLAVERIGAPDATRPWTAVSTLPINTAITTVPALSTTAFILQAGSDIDNFTNCPAEMWGGQITTTSNFAATRGDAIGDSDRVILIANFANVVSGPQLTDISAIQDGGTFTVTGANLKPGGVAPTVTIAGVSQTISSSTSTQIDCTFVLGTMKFGDQTVTISTTEGSLTSLEQISPQTGHAYFNARNALAAANLRLTASADLVVADQIEVDNTLIQLLEDDSFIAPGGVTFSARANDGTGWGSWGLQDRTDPVSPPTLNGTIPTFAFATGADIQFDVADYALGWSTLVFNGTFPSGIAPSTLALGVVTGRVSVESDTTLTVTYTSVGGSVTSNSFHLTFTTPPPTQILVPSVVGLTAAQAAVTLSTSGFVLGIQTTGNSSTVLPGLVISQSPTAGTLVNSGTGVDITISLGPPPFIQPPKTTRRNLRSFLLG